MTILVNNAGVLGPIVDIVDFSEKEYFKVCVVNQHAHFYGMKTVIPSMKKAGGGSIVNVSSTAGMVSIVGVPNVACGGGKFASRGMTRQVAIQCGPDNTRVNSAHPGYLKTPVTGRGHRRDRRWHCRAGPVTPFGRPQRE